MTTQILIIDEDQAALERYREALAPKAAHWSVSCIDNAEDAVALAREQVPDIVIAALSVNAGQGVQLLSEIEKIAPDAQRFITATAEDKPKLEATFGSSFQFLPSPCPADRLITEIQRCVAIDTWLGNARIKRLVAKMGEFPSLPPIYLKVVNALNSRDASAASIAHAISGDLAISAKVLQTVNSSYYGFEEKISNITQAVSILGIECVKNLVLAIQVFSRLGHSAEQKAITDQLWHHSMSVAVTAKRIVEHESSDEKSAEEAYSAGLMHDIGKLVLLNAVPEQFNQARSLAREKSIPLWQAENVVIGCNHAETGAYVLARWGMPANLTEAVALHHEPINSFGKRFSALAAVHIANSLVWERQREDHPDATPNEQFLADIGKASAWPTWQAVATGKPVAQAEKKPLSLQSDEASESEPKQTKTAPASKAPSAQQPTPQPSNTSSAAIASENSEESRRRSPLLAIAACATAAALGIYFIATSGKSDAPELALADSQPSSALAQSVQKARELSGVSRTEEALEEILEAEATDGSAATEEEPAAAEQPIATTNQDSGGEPQLAEPAEENSAPAETASEPQVAEASKEEEPKTDFPKPQIAEPKDVFPQIQLAGIFFSKENPLASVNGRIRRVGDSVSGAQIVRIERQQIVVRYKQELRSFKLD